MQAKVGFSFLDVILLEVCVGICCNDFASGCALFLGVLFGLCALLVVAVSYHVPGHGLLQ